MSIVESSTLFVTDDKQVSSKTVELTFLSTHRDSWLDYSELNKHQTQLAVDDNYKLILALLARTWVACISMWQLAHLRKRKICLLVCSYMYNLCLSIFTDIYESVRSSVLLFVGFSICLGEQVHTFTQALVQYSLLIQSFAIIALKILKILMWSVSIN